MNFFAGLEETFKQGGALQIPLAFLFGFLSSFTPCVFPLIPVTISLFGVNPDQSRLKSFLLSLSYVAGLSVTYTALGLLSAVSGAVFGSALGHPAVVVVLAIFLTLLALFSLEVIQLNFIGGVQNRASKVGGAGFLGAFLMGTVSGLVAAPCVGPALIIVLSIAASSHSTIWGGLLLFAYSLGLGTIFLVLGTFSGLITKLPRSGNWLNAVKFVIAAGLLLVVIFISKRFIQPALFLSPGSDLLLLVLMENLAILLGWLAYRMGSAPLKVAAAILMAFSAHQIVFGESSGVRAELVDESAACQGSGQIIWQTSLDEAKRIAREKNSIMMVDLYADWCTACKELDERTFSNDKVKQELSKIVTARVDFTEPDPVLTDKYDIKGLPSVLFLNANGEEIPGTRITGFEPPSDFLKDLDKAKAAAK